MNALVVYDSRHGNTAEIALAISETVGAQALLVGEAKPADLSGCDLLIIGSPTVGARHSREHHCHPQEPRPAQGLLSGGSQLGMPRPYRIIRQCNNTGVRGGKVYEVPLVRLPPTSEVCAQ